TQGRKATCAAAEARPDPDGRKRLRRRRGRPGLRVRRLSGHAVQIVLVRVLDEDRDDVALRQVPGVAQMDLAIDFGGVSLGAAGGAAFLADRVDDHVDRPADLCGELRRGDGGGLFHEAGVALLLDLFGDDARAIVARRAADALVLERAAPAAPGP